MLRPRDWRELEEFAHGIRTSVVRMLVAAGSGHLGGSMSSADILAVLYGSVLNLYPDAPKTNHRDRFILSAGHVAPAYYAALALRGFFDEELLYTLRQLGSPLQGHPSLMHGLPGVESSSGSLGQGLSIALGLALGARMRNESWRAYVLMGDGELQEGQVWEAAMAASHHQVGNLVAIVDRNGLQIDGPTSEVMNLEPLASKWLAFGWNVIEVDGHSVRELQTALGQVSVSGNTRPSLIIAKTVMGCGIESIEGDHQWHGKAPTAEQGTKFLAELERSYQGRQMGWRGAGPEPLRVYRAKRGGAC